MITKMILIRKNRQSYFRIISWKFYGCQTIQGNHRVGKKIEVTQVSIDSRVDSSPMSGRIEPKVAYEIGKINETV